MNYQELLEDIRLVRESKLLGNRKQDFDGLTGYNSREMSKILNNPATQHAVEKIFEGLKGHNVDAQEIIQWAQMVRDFEELTSIIKMPAKADKVMLFYWINILVGNSEFISAEEDINIKLNKFKAMRISDWHRFSLMLAYFYAEAVNLREIMRTNSEIDELSLCILGDFKTNLLKCKKGDYTLNLYGFLVTLLSDTELNPCAPGCSLNLTKIIGKIKGYFDILFTDIPKISIVPPPEEILGRHYWETTNERHSKLLTTSEFLEAYGFYRFWVLKINLEDNKSDVLGFFSFFDDKYIMFFESDLQITNVSCEVIKDDQPNRVCIHFDPKIICNGIDYGSKWLAIPESKILKAFDKSVQPDQIENQFLLANGCIVLPCEIRITQTAYIIILKGGKEYELPFTEYPLLKQKRPSDIPIIKYNRQTNQLSASWYDGVLILLANAPEE